MIDSMKLLLALLSLASGLLAQNALNLAAQTLTVRPGNAVTVTVNYNASDAAGLQWAMTFPAGVAITPSVGTAAAAASKTLTCGVNSTPCLVFGINQNLMTAGQVASYSLAFPGSTVPGPAIVTLSAPLGAKPNASSIAVTAGPPLTITVLRIEDLNGDGVVNTQDVQLSVDQVIGTTGCGTGDINSDGRCDLFDVLLVVLKALGL